MADATQQQLDSTHQAANAAVDQLYSYAGQLLADLTSTTTALNAATGQVQSLTNQNTTLQQQHTTDQATIQKLQNQPAPVATGGQVHDAKGAATTVTLAVGAIVNGDTYKGAIFKSAQKYAVVLNDNDVVNGISGTSDSGGIHAGGANVPTQAKNITVNGATALNCGQNGFSVFAQNSVFNGITTGACNALNFPVYNEAGAGKIWSSSNCVFNGWNDTNTQGCGPWTDGACQNITLNGGIVSGNTVAGSNAGDQVSCYRTELTSGHTHNGVHGISGAGQNSAWIISDSNHITDNGGIYRGQVGIVYNGRPTAKTMAGVTIDTSLHDFTFNGTTLSSFYWPDNLPAPPVCRGVKFTQAAGQPVLYITHSGKPSTPVDLATFQKTYDPAATLVAA